jgi:hypothetical protein
MRRLKRFMSLCREDRLLLLRAFFLVGAIRAGLCLLPFRIVRRLTGNASQSAAPMLPLGRCIWAVRAVSRCVPGATCLTQALAAQVLLARYGYDSRIEIGVAKDEQRRFRAHAWVMCGDEIVIGEVDLEHYVPLAAWDTTIERTD